MEAFAENYQIHYERSLFQLAATLAHECFHVLTGLWSGFNVGSTPPTFSGADESDSEGESENEDESEDEGEAGDWWEYKHGFNGSVHLVWSRSGTKAEDDPYPLDNENMSAGIPFVHQKRYSIDGSPNGEVWTRISHAYIRDVIKKGIFRNIAGSQLFRNSLTLLYRC